MDLDLKRVDITTEEDWTELKELWEEEYGEDYDFEVYKNKLLKLNCIVGFGRGFWPGVHDYSYLVFHKGKNKYYWLLRDRESDFDVYLYEIDEKADIFALLHTKSVDNHFSEYDAELNYEVFYDLARGVTADMPEEMKLADLTELFGEDTPQLKAALMYFSPGSQGSKYPHKEFDKKYSLPRQRYELDLMVEAYNEGSFNVYREGTKLCITLNEDTFELKRVNNKENDR